jgi:hypothetical protein
MKHRKEKAMHQLSFLSSFEEGEERCGALNLVEFSFGRNSPERREIERTRHRLERAMYQKWCESQGLNPRTLQKKSGG